jgi:hypothetical protein
MAACLPEAAAGVSGYICIHFFKKFSTGASSALAEQRQWNIKRQLVLTGIDEEFTEYKVTKFLLEYGDTPFVMSLSENKKLKQTKCFLCVNICNISLLLLAPVPCFRTTAN